MLPSKIAPVELMKSPPQAGYVICLLRFHFEQMIPWLDQQLWRKSTFKSDMAKHTDSGKPEGGLKTYPTRTRLKDIWEQKLPRRGHPFGALWWSLGVQLAPNQTGPHYFFTVHIGNAAPHIMTMLLKWMFANLAGLAPELSVSPVSPSTVL